MLYNLKLLKTFSVIYLVLLGLNINMKHMAAYHVAFQLHVVSFCRLKLQTLISLYAPLFCVVIEGVQKQLEGRTTC